MEQIKRIPTKLTVYEYLIIYEYRTWKSGRRVTDKRTIKSTSLEEAKDLFKKWWKKVRTISNAGILDIREIEENRQEIVL